MSNYWLNTEQKLFMANGRERLIAFRAYQISEANNTKDFDAKHETLKRQMKIAEHINGGPLDADDFKNLLWRLGKKL